MCKTVSSEKMIFLWLLKKIIKQAVSRDKDSSKQSGSLPATPLASIAPSQQVLSGKTAPTESRARVQILTTQPHIPDPATHSHSLRRVQGMSLERKAIEIIFYDPCTTLNTILTDFSNTARVLNLRKYTKTFPCTHTHTALSRSFSSTNHSIV